MSLATLTCPYCKNKEKVTIPKGMCLPFHKCKKCKRIIKARKLCCVICEYSDKKCPVSIKK